MSDITLQSFALLRELRYLLLPADAAAVEITLPRYISASLR